MMDYLFRAMFTCLLLTCLVRPLNATPWQRHKQQQLANAEAQGLLGKAYDTKVGVFVVVYDGNDAAWSMRVEGSGTYVPLSLQSYQAAPDDWWHAPEYEEKYPYAGDQSAHARVRKVLPPGSRIKIVDIRTCNGTFGRAYNVYGMIEDPRFPTKILMNSLMGCTYVGVAPLEPDARYLVCAEKR